MKNPKMQLKVIKEIIWKDMNNNIIEIWKVGDIVDGYGPEEKNPTYYVTGMGCVWADELVRIDEL